MNERSEPPALLAGALYALINIFLYQALFMTLIRETRKAATVVLVLAIKIAFLALLVVVLSGTGARFIIFFLASTTITLVAGGIGAALEKGETTARPRA